jgi:NAD(P)-dependent dehydrogenase (short-subunit alcohol dehydrogenase family)
VTVAGYWLPAATARILEDMSKTWFITGASRGFGRVWAQAALERGDRVAATARDVSTLDDLAARHGDALLALTLDVTDRDAAFAAVAAAHERFGTLDIIINNAGYGLFGAVEEVSAEQARAQLDTNLLGPLWVTQAALPILRAQGSGHVVQVSSIGGVAAFPMIGLYNASKWGLEAFSEALAAEVAPHGVHVTIVEPGPYGTDWSGDSAVHAEPLDAYEDLRAARRAGAAKQTPGDPGATAAAILALVDADDPPLRLFLGPFPLPVAERVYADRLATWRAWAPVADAAA